MVPQERQHPKQRWADPSSNRQRPDAPHASRHRCSSLRSELAKSSFTSSSSQSSTHSLAFWGSSSFGVHAAAAHRACVGHYVPETPRCFEAGKSKRTHTPSQTPRTHRPPQAQARAASSAALLTPSGAGQSSAPELSAGVGRSGRLRVASLLLPLTAHWVWCRALSTGRREKGE